MYNYLLLKRTPYGRMFASCFDAGQFDAAVADIDAQIEAEAEVEQAYERAKEVFDEASRRRDKLKLRSATFSQEV